MGWASLIKSLASLWTMLIGYFRDKRLTELGAAESVLKGVQDADKAIELANAARANANSVPISTDQDNRANK